MGFQPFSPNDPTRTHDATLSLVAADEGASTYRVKLWSCQAPTCYCSNLVFECTPDSDADPADPSRHPAEPRACCLNVVARRPVYLDTTSPDEHQFGDAVVAALTDADWIWLSEYFRASKRKLFENLDIDTCDVRFPPDIQIEPGRMLGYGELFPWAESWVFSHENHSWILEDCYCTLPDCDCSNALLEFFPVPPADVLETTDEQTPVEPVAGLWLNLKSGRTAEPFKTAGHPSPHALLKSVRASQPDLDRRLQRRANHIHRLADRLLPRPDSTLAPSSTFIRTSPKTGRNDPCPCGSGRKFKQCCGKPV